LLKTTAEAKILGQEAELTPEKRASLKRPDTSLSDLELWRQQNPNAPISRYWGQKASVEANAKARAEMSLMSGMAAGGVGSTGTLPQDPAVASMVKAMAEGRMQFPGSFALRSPYWQNMIKMVATYDPTFDATQWPVRVAVRQDFTKGKAAANVRSLNTAIGHLDSLRDAAKGLNNASAPLWNQIANYGFTQAGDPRVVKFNTAANAVAGEAATVFKGTAGTDQEIRAWREQINSSQSPEQINMAVDQITTLLASRMDALDSQWTTGMKRARDFRLLNDKSVKILQKMGRTDIASQEAAALAPTASDTGAGAKAPPAVGTIKGGYRFKGGNPADKANWVKVGP
jgi:hypothetical protein